MNKLKKIIVSIIIGLIAVLGMYNTSNAYSVGQHIDVTYNDYLYNGNIYCCEHHQALREHNSYRIISEVSIEGNKSTDYKGKSINSWYNAKLAYILSATDTNAIKNSVWNYMYTWLAKVGNKHAGLYTSFSNGVHGVYTWLDTASTNYANSIKETTEIKDNTDKSKIKVKVVDEDEKSYIRVGPFNWTFPGTMEKIEIQDQNKDKIKNVKFSQYKGEEQKIIDVSEIKSGKNFYVYIPMGTDVTKITKITGKSSTSIKSTKIWFLESLEGYKQNLIIREPYEAPLDVETPFDVDIPLLGNLKVIKVNKDNKQVKL